MPETIFPGTVAFEAVMILQSKGGEMLTGALAKCLGRSAKRLPKHLAPALRAGLIARRINCGSVFWSRGHAVLSAPAKPVIPVEPGVLAFASVFHYADSFAQEDAHQRIFIPQSKNPQQLATDVGSLTN